ncbi:MAG: hypothetical protein KDC92_08515 [Bacteroidetes bacterium]|nr:hypothetical protein [Bacteroidota bacterium]
MKLPLSKSINNRLQVLRHLYFPSVELEVSNANDSQLMQKALTALSTGNDIDVEDAGTVARFTTAVAAITNTYHGTIDGSDRMRQRSISTLVNALNEIGADIQYEDSHKSLPIKINGKNLEGGKLVIDHVESSQFITALMLIAPTFKHGLEIEFKQKPSSFKYIELTANLMLSLGFELQLSEENLIVKPVIPSTKRSLNDKNEIDWSAAVYPLLISELSPDLKLKTENSINTSLQGDSAVFAILADIKMQSESANSKPIEFDFSAYPDLAQPFICFCAVNKWAFCFIGLETLPGKETDRLFAMKTELARMGIESTTTSHSFKIETYPSAFNSDVVFETYQDHRMAMSLFLIMLKKPAYQLSDCETVKKSFPDFWKELEKLGFEFELA